MEIDLDKLKALAAHATPGVRTIEKGTAGNILVKADAEQLVCIVGNELNPQSVHDAEFLAALDPSVIQNLALELNESRNERKVLVGEVSRLKARLLNPHPANGYSVELSRDGLISVSCDHSQATVIVSDPVLHRFIFDSFLFRDSWDASDRADGNAFKVITIDGQKDDDRSTQINVELLPGEAEKLAVKSPEQLSKKDSQHCILWAIFCVLIVVMVISLGIAKDSWNTPDENLYVLALVYGAAFVIGGGILVHVTQEGYLWEKLSDEESDALLNSSKDIDVRTVEILSPIFKAQGHVLKHQENVAVAIAVRMLAKEKHDGVRKLWSSNNADYQAN